MSKTRLEAFSDGVIAILITIMVLELKVPHGTSWEALHPTVFTLLLYLMSFVYLGIYWSNHHHLLHATDRVNGAILWANLHLLFWLSLIPFVTGWMSENRFQPVPVALYGFVLLACGVAYYFLAQCLRAIHGRDSAIAHSLGRDAKGLVSIVIYVIAIGLAFVQPWISCALYVVVAAIWFIPDRRFEKG